ncbi:unnamed protein product [Leptosia nina]|uniref:Fatty acyl-CoA reductase n=1 Tax=Leptosia nina TaxID=320188 RepID=A0AAV1IYC6_9NEOP
MSVADFYAGKCVFITGSTGFLGKVLLEKILYSCPEIEKIYILLRGKKGLGISERLQQILELPIFTRLKRDRPKDLEKIYPVAGNIDEDGLGLSKEDHQLLIDEVLVHVSTAYSNIHKIFIEEKFYPPPIPIYRVDEIIKERPDQKEAKLLIVCASLAEPIPGWLDTWGGATGIIVPACKGLARVVPGRGSNVLDLIPVDYVINLMIVAATRNVSPRDVLIYNCATSTENPLTLNKLSKTVIPDGKKHKFNELPIPSLMFIESKLVLNITAAVLQTCPAILADAFLRMAGKEPK